LDVDSFGCTALSLNLLGTFLERLDLFEAIVIGVHGQLRLEICGEAIIAINGATVTATEF